MRSFIYSSFFILLLLLVPSGCRKKASVPIPASPAPPVAVPTNPVPPAITPRVPAPSAEPVEPEPPPKTAATPDFFALAELNYQAGNYRQAAQSYEKFLSAAPKSKNRAEALFHLGLCRALANDQSRDLRQAEAAFRRLIAEFPQSQYRDQAEFILSLQGQIEKLRADVKERDDRIKRLGDELQRLKEIDMQRRPSRP